MEAAGSARAMQKPILSRKLLFGTLPLIVCLVGKSLNAQTVGLSVTSNPSGASIEIGYVQFGHTPATIPLRAGTWKITLRYPGMQTWQQPVELRDSQPTKIHADFLPLPKTDQMKPDKPLPVFSTAGTPSSKAPIVDAPRALPPAPPKVDAPELPLTDLPRVDPHAPMIGQCLKAEESVRSLKSVTDIGINYTNYSTRVLDAKIAMDQCTSGRSIPSRIATINTALGYYIIASRAWNAEMISSPVSKMSAYVSVGRTLAEPPFSDCGALKALSSGPTYIGGRADPEAVTGALIAEKPGILWTCAEAVLSSLPLEK